MDNENNNLDYRDCLSLSLKQAYVTMNKLNATCRKISAAKAILLMKHDQVRHETDSLIRRLSAKLASMHTNLEKEILDVVTCKTQYLDNWEEHIFENICKIGEVCIEAENALKIENEAVAQRNAVILINKLEILSLRELDSDDDSFFENSVNIRFVPGVIQEIMEKSTLGSLQISNEDKKADVSKVNKTLQTSAEYINGTPSELKTAENPNFAYEDEESNTSKSSSARYLSPKKFARTNSLSKPYGVKFPKQLPHGRGRSRFNSVYYWSKDSKTVKKPGHLGHVDFSKFCQLKITHSSDDHIPLQEPNTIESASKNVKSEKIASESERNEQHVGQSTKTVSESSSTTSDKSQLKVQTNSVSGSLFFQNSQCAENESQKSSHPGKASSQTSESISGVSSASEAFDGAAEIKKKEDDNCNETKPFANTSNVSSQKSDEPSSCSDSLEDKIIPPLAVMNKAEITVTSQSFQKNEAKEQDILSASAVECWNGVWDKNIIHKVKNEPQITSQNSSSTKEELKTYSENQPGNLTIKQEPESVICGKEKETEVLNGSSEKQTLLEASNKTDSKLTESTTSGLMENMCEKTVEIKQEMTLPAVHCEDIQNSMTVQTTTVNKVAVKSCPNNSIPNKTNEVVTCSEDDSSPGENKFLEADSSSSLPLSESDDKGILRNPSNAEVSEDTIKTSTSDDKRQSQIDLSQLIGEEQNLKVIQLKHVAQIGLPTRGYNRRPLFQFPIGITKNRHDEVIICDTGAAIIRVFRYNCLVFSIEEGLHREKFVHPSAVVVNDNDAIFVKDDRAIHVFDRDGTPLDIIGINVLKNPYGLAMTQDGKLVVLDVWKKRPTLYLFHQDGRIASSPLFTPLIPPKYGSKCRFICLFEDKLLVSDLGFHTRWKIHVSSEAVTSRTPTF